MVRSLVGLAALAILPACGEKDDTGAATDTDVVLAGTGTGAAATGTGTGTGTGTTGAALEIVGTWNDDFGTSHDITEALWTQRFGDYDPLLFHVRSWDNPSGWLVAQNDAAAPYFPGLYSRFDWVWSAERLHVCQVVYDAPDAEAAEAAAGADEEDLDGVGCGGFPWSGLDPVSR